jgi:hypothetical protein
MGSLRNRDWIGVGIGLTIALVGAVLTWVGVIVAETGGFGVVFPGLVVVGLWKAGKSLVAKEPTWVEDEARTRAEAEILRDRQQDGQPGS